MQYIAVHAVINGYVKQQLHVYKRNGEKYRAPEKLTSGRSDHVAACVLTAESVVCVFIAAHILSFSRMFSSSVLTAIGSVTRRVLKPSFDAASRFACLSSRNIDSSGMRLYLLHRR